MASLSYKENTLLAFQHKEPEYLPLVSDIDTCAPRGMDYICESISVNGVAKDWFGQSWTFEPNIGGANPTPGMHLVPDITKWRETMKFPDLRRLDWEGRSAADTAKWDRDRRLSRIVIGFGLWERMFCVMEFQQALCALVEEPEACYDFFSAVADHKIRLYDYLIRYYKPDILIMHDDYGSGSGMFMAPETWRALIKPNLQRVIDSITSKGVMYEHHCCGYFAPILGEIADMGCCAANTMHISNKPAALKKEVGHKMCFIGGFDTQFMDKPGTSEEEIRASLRKTCDELTPGGSFVAAAGLKTLNRNPIVHDELNRISANYYTCARPADSEMRSMAFAGDIYVNK